MLRRADSLKLFAAIVALTGCSGGPTMPRGCGNGSASSAPSAIQWDAGTAALGIEGAKAVDCVHRGKGKDYTVGPGQAHESLADVPFAKLVAGDTVRIFHRAEPYREKIMVGGVGTAQDPIRVCGVPGPKGELPVLDGENAKTRPGLEFAFDGHQVRGLIIVGWRHSEPWKQPPEHIVIEGLELRNANPPHKFTDKAGKETPWADLAAGIFVQRAKFVTIRGNVVHGNGNGLFVGTAGGDELTSNVLIEGNYIYGNGSGTWYHHNVYNEAANVTYQFNRFGPPVSGKEGILGANIKERSAGVVVRYNWIEDGSHMLDLVDAQEAQDPNLKSPAYRESFVYGNVFVRGGPSGSMIRYGGDSDLHDRYRKGTLHFFHNTVIVQNENYKNYDRTDVFELSTNDEKLIARNNVLFSTIKPSDKIPVALLGERDDKVGGTAVFENNWISEGWIPTQQMPGKVPSTTAKVTGLDAAIRGAEPGFSDLKAGDFRLGESAAARAAGAKLDFGEHAVKMQYVRHQRGEPRPDDAAPVPGAFAAPK